MSLAEPKEAPDGGLIFLAGPPGAGKSAFCRQAVADSVAAARPAIFVATERTVPDIVDLEVK